MPQENDPLQSLIAKILDADARGEAFDKEEILRNHPEHEQSLTEFSAKHDSTEASGRDEEATRRSLKRP